MKGKLFEYAILYHPKASKDQNDRGETPKSEVIQEPKSVLALNADQVGILAARSLPDQYVDKLDDMEIVVRPF